MSEAPPSFSCCFCWNVMSQPSVSPLCDLINECWAMRLDPLWGGHIWTLFTEIHICLSLTFQTLSQFLFSVFFSLLHSDTPLLFYLNSHFVSFYAPNVYSIILFLLSCPSSHTSVPFLLFSYCCPLTVFLFAPLHLCITFSLLLSPHFFLHGGQALLSPSLPPGAPHLSWVWCQGRPPVSPRWVWVFVHRMFNHKWERMKGEGRRGEMKNRGDK